MRPARVTGANRTWIAALGEKALPDSVLFPSVTKARELIQAGKVLHAPAFLRQVIDLPADPDALDAADRPLVDRFLRKARAQG